MAANKIIPLKTPLPGHEGQVTAIELREPTGEEFLKFGDPRSYGRTPGGVMMMITDGAIVRAYLEKCIVKPDSLIAMSMGLSDGMAVQEALFDFFDSALATSGPPSPASSST